MAVPSCTPACPLTQKKICPAGGSLRLRGSYVGDSCGIESCPTRPPLILVHSHRNFLYGRYNHMQFNCSKVLSQCQNFFFTTIFDCSSFYSFMQNTYIKTASHILHACFHTVNLHGLVFHMGNLKSVPQKRGWMLHNKAPVSMLSVQSPFTSVHNLGAALLWLPGISTVCTLILGTHLLHSCNIIDPFSLSLEQLVYRI
jgi:hypothetical protein